MIIEKSAFYKTSINEKNIENINSGNSNANPTSLENEEFSFLQWFKGLVNPLQNLPIISGIYSSVNSGDESSDRDLVQNSLGGFLYGGPIGAIAGFGTWVFNKIFEKTPTELAFDFTGVSEMWKDDGNSEDVANLTDQDIKKSESQVFSFFNNGRQIQKRDKPNGNISKTESQEKTTSFSRVDKKNAVKLSNIEPQEFINLSKVRDNPPKLMKTEPQEIVNLSKVSDDLSKINEMESIKPAIKNDYRQINFSYPVWKPENLNKGLDGKLDMSKSKDKYLDLGSKTQTSWTLNIDA